MVVKRACVAHICYGVFSFFFFIAEHIVKHILEHINVRTYKVQASSFWFATKNNHEMDDVSHIICMNESYIPHKTNFK